MEWAELVCQVLGIKGEGMILLLMALPLFDFLLHSQEADSRWFSESPRSPVSQLLPVEVSGITTPTTHEGHQLLRIAGGVKLD